MMPRNLKAVYDKAVDDPFLEDLTADLALLEARIQLLLSSLPAASGIQTWSDLSQAWGAFQRAVNADDERGQLRNLRRMGELIQQGQTEQATWDELYSLLEARRRTSESKQRIAVQAQQVVAIELVFGMLANLVQVVKASVYEHTDTKTARKIIVDTSAAYRRILGPGTDS